MHGAGTEVYDPVMGSVALPSNGAPISVPAANAQSVAAQLADLNVSQVLNGQNWQTDRVTW